MATTPPSTKAAPKEKEYRALTPIEHDGEKYAVGETLSLSDRHAAPLLAVQAVEATGKEAA